MKKLLIAFFILVVIAFSISTLIYMSLPEGRELSTLSENSKSLPKVTGALSQGGDFDLESTLINLLCLIILLPIGVYFVNYLKEHFGVKKND